MFKCFIYLGSHKGGQAEQQQRQNVEMRKHRNNCFQLGQSENNAKWSVSFMQLKSLL